MIRHLRGKISQIGALSAALFAGVLAAGEAAAQTSMGELEGRAAPVSLRRCIAGSNAGSLCNENSDCPGSSCKDRNVFNVSVAVHFNASAAQLTSIQNALSAGSAMLFDVTDGQAEIGLATIHNNAFGTTQADFRIYPASTPVWWNANTGNWRVGGSVNVSIDNIQAAGAPGESMAHEFLHLAFDPRDEYESRPVGCTNSTSSDSCPIGGSTGTNCIMDGGGTGTEGQFSELCYGQGNTTNINDFSAGDHDADNTTEQSRCRSNRSCWDQVVWSYPNVFVKPAGAPNAAANGATVNPTQFTVVNNTSRVVLVLDQSGSMSAEAPARIERLKVAANDFIALAETGTELGIVTFATNVVSEKAIGALPANRAPWTSVVNGISPTTRTNISDGLNRARTLINNAGGVTGNTFVVLMTDGLNNEPSPQATADAALQTAINDLLAAGIEVYVTCTGGDLGLQSQCSEIATGTGGFYVDSADAAALPPSFAEIAARGFGHEMIGEFNAAKQSAFAAAIKKAEATIRKPRGQTLAPTKLSDDYRAWLVRDKPGVHSYFVEKGSSSALFTLQWPGVADKVSARLVSPSNATFDMRPMPLGLFAQIPNPESGVWRIEVAQPSITNYTARGYSRNYVVTVGAGVRHPSVKPGEPLYFYAYPRTEGKAVSNPLRTIKALVKRPDGTYDLMDLTDQGRAAGDDVADDGIFTGIYKNTQARGAYSISAFWAVDKWGRAMDAVGHTHGKGTHVNDIDDYVSPAFMRETHLSATVIDPERDVEKRPEDPPPGAKPNPDPGQLKRPAVKNPRVKQPGNNQ